MVELYDIANIRKIILKKGSLFDGLWFYLYLYPKIEMKKSMAKKKKYSLWIIGLLLAALFISSYPIWSRGREVSLLTSAATASHSVNSVFTKKVNRGNHMGALVCKKCHPYLYKATCWAYIYFRDVLGIDLASGKNEIDLAKEEQITEKKIELQELKNIDKELSKKRKEIKKEIRQIKKDAKEDKREQKEKEKEAERKKTPF